jgi:hypothetical protein
METYGLTVFDAIKGNEAQWQEVLLSAVSQSMQDLGSDVYQLEWADKHARADVDVKAA